MIKGEFLRTARSVLSIRDFIPKTKELLECMKQQSSKRTTTGTSLRKITLAHLENFQHFSISCQDLLNIFSEDTLSHFSLCVYIYLCEYKQYVYINIYVNTYIFHMYIYILNLYVCL